MKLYKHLLVEEKLHREIKENAALEGRSMNDFVARVLVFYLTSEHNKS